MALGHRLSQPILALFRPEGSGQVLDIVAVVAVLGKFHRVLTQDQLLIPGVDGGGELLDLVAGVVHIEFPPDLIAVPIQDAGQGVAQDAAAGVAHVHGAGGIGGDELHHDLLPLALVQTAVVLALAGDGSEHIGVPAVGQAEVQKAGAGGLQRGKPGSLQLRILDQRLGDLARGHAQDAGAGHGVVGGKIAVGGILGDLHRAAEPCPGGQLTLLRRALIGLLQNLVYAVFRFLDPIRHVMLPPSV